MKSLRLLLILALLPLAGRAAPITAERAAQLARRVLATPRVRGGADLQLLYALGASPRTRGGDPQADLYVFGREERSGRGGFVVVAGDDRLPELLGYSPDGQFAPGQMPPALAAWLEGYTRAARRVRTGGSLPRATSFTVEPVAPILQRDGQEIRWGQDEPYHLSTPGRYPTGCVATALTQIMYYHQWPARAASAEVQYTVDRRSRTYRLGTQDIAWAEMRAQYGASASAESQRAVAFLMAEVGAAIGTSYARSVSGASEGASIAALQEIFGYSEDMRLVYRSEKSAQQWVETIRSELAEGRPVFMTGNSETIGHAFVCDGMDAQGLGHINWGWNGMSNGYFRLDDLDPRQHGTGGSDGGTGYSLEVSIITGLAPRTGTGPLRPFTPRFSYRRCLMGAVRVARSTPTYPVPINRVHIEALGSVSGDLYVALEDAQGNIASRNSQGQDYSNKLNMSGTAATVQGFPTVGMIPAHFPPSGEYRLRFVVRLRDGREVGVRRVSQEGDYIVRCSADGVEFVLPAERYLPRLEVVGKRPELLYEGLEQEAEIELRNSGQGLFDGYIRAYVSGDASPSATVQPALDRGLSLDEGGQRVLRVPLGSGHRQGRRRYLHLYSQSYDQEQQVHFATVEYEVGPPVSLDAPGRVRIVRKEEVYYRGQPLDFDVEVQTKPGKGVQCKVEPYIYRYEGRKQVQVQILSRQTAFRLDGGAVALKFDELCTLPEGRYRLILNVIHDRKEDWGGEFRFKVREQVVTPPPSPVTIVRAEVKHGAAVTTGQPMALSITYTLSQKGQARSISLRATAIHRRSGVSTVLGEKTFVAKPGATGTLDFSRPCPLEPGEYTVQFHELDKGLALPITGLSAIDLRVKPAPTPGEKPNRPSAQVLPTEVAQTDGELRVSPNPASSVLHVHELQGETLARVYDLSGRELLRMMVSPSGLLPLRELPAGLYLLRVGERRAWFTKR